MKKLIIVLLLLLPFTLNGQGVFSKFGKPVKGTPATNLVKGVDGKTLNWYFQPTAELMAVKWDYSKELKQFTPSPFSAAGVGLGVQHYTSKEKDGSTVLVNDYGANLLFMLNGDAISGKGGIGIAGTINFIGFVGVGGGYDFTNKHAVLILGGQWNF